MKKIKSYINQSQFKFKQNEVLFQLIFEKNVETTLFVDFLKFLLSRIDLYIDLEKTKLPSQEELLTNYKSDAYITNPKLDFNLYQISLICDFYENQDLHLDDSISPLYIEPIRKAKLLFSLSKKILSKEGFQSAKDDFIELHPSNVRLDIKEVLINRDLNIGHQDLRNTLDAHFCIEIEGLKYQEFFDRYNKILDKSFAYIHISSNNDHENIKSFIKKEYNLEIVSDFTFEIKSRKKDFTYLPRDYEIVDPDISNFQSDFIFYTDEFRIYSKEYFEYLILNFILDKYFLKDILREKYKVCYRFNSALSLMDRTITLVIDTLLSSKEEISTIVHNEINKFKVVEEMLVYAKSFILDDYYDDLDIPYRNSLISANYFLSYLDNFYRVNLNIIMETITLADIQKTLDNLTFAANIFKRGDE